MDKIQEQQFAKAIDTLMVIKYYLDKKDIKSAKIILADLNKKINNL